MTFLRSQTGLVFLTLGVLLGLIIIRILSPGFVLGTDTFDHPYRQFIAALMGAGFIWLGIVIWLRRIGAPSQNIFYSLVAIGIIARLLFLGSTPIYEDDWNRYLWDGMVTVEGHNPYQYPPDVFFKVKLDAPQHMRDLQALSAGVGNGITTKINNAYLTTIYPPVAMAVFAVAAKIDPANLDVLRLLYFVIEGLGFLLLLKALQAYERASYWALLYWLNPLLIYSIYNVAHMDVILFPIMVGALIAVKTRPFWAGILLGVAGAVKFWPLLLGPVLLRHYRHRPRIFIGAGVLSGIICLLLILPMLLSINANSGLVAYSSEWQRSSFIYPYLKIIFSPIAEVAPRLVVAVVLTALSFYLAFKRNVNRLYLPAALMGLSLTLYLLSPTGYPWYLLWILPFYPFLPLYGVGLLTVMVGLYYIRYAMGERGSYDIYSQFLVPLQFGLPILVIALEMKALHRTRGGL